MENGGKKNWIYGIISLLLLALVVETGFLISQAVSKSKEEKEESLEAGPSPSRLSQPATFYPAVPRTFASPTYRSRWDPFFEEMRRMQEEMAQVFDESFHRMRSSPTFQAPVTSFFNPDQFPTYAPPIDLQETENAYIAKADLPGLEKEKIQVSVSGNILTLQGEREEETKKEDATQGVYTSERTYGTFSRSISLPGPVDESAITADYKNGVLTVTLPKLKGEPTPPKKVQIT